MPKIYAQFLIWFTIVLSPGLVFAAGLDIARYADEFLKVSGAPGVSVSVLERGKSTPLTVSRGTACLNHNVPMNDRTIMKLGSVTKILTAARIQMLIEEGKLGYETPISTFFPAFPRGDKITIRQLLTHSAGIHEVLMLEPFHSNPAKPWTGREQLEVIAKAPLDFPPGTAQKYSNSGYLMLGLIIESLSGESYGRQIVEKVAVPLGMSSLQAGDDTTVVMNEGCGYSADGRGKLINPMLFSIIPAMGSGNLLGTAADVVRLVNLGKLIKHNLIDEPPSGPYLLANGTPAQKHEQFPDLDFDTSQQNGFVTFYFRDRPLKLVGKDGMFPGFATYFLYDPKTETAVAVMTNLETKAIEAMQLAVRILEEKRHQEQTKTAHGGGVRQ